MRSERLIGCSGIRTVDSRTLYPGLQAPSGAHLVDAATARVDPAVSLSTGLPGGHAIKLRPPGRFQDLVDRPVMAWGAATRCWRQGRIVSLWPKPLVGDASVALCLIAQAPPSRGGDSGGLWLGKQGEEFVAIALHRGFPPMRGTTFAIGVDINAAMPLLGIDAFA
jgi:hypothetical protein